MNIETVYTYLRTKSGATEGFPFGEDTLVFKVGPAQGGKIYAILALNDVPLRINLKCNPEKAIELREEYHQVIPGYHMNKKHWNTVILDGELTIGLVKEMIDHSYDLVLKSFSANKRKELGL